MTPMFCPLPRDGGDPDFRVSPSFCFVALLLFHNVGLLEARVPARQKINSHHAKRFIT